MQYTWLVAVITMDYDTTQSGDKNEIYKSPFIPSWQLEPVDVPRIFNPANKSVTTYFKRFLTFINANNIDDKLVPTLFLPLWVRTTAPKLREIHVVPPQLPQEKTCDVLVTTLKENHNLEPIIIAERFHCYHRSLGTSESMSSYDYIHFPPEIFQNGFKNNLRYSRYC